MKNFKLVTVPKNGQILHADNSIICHRIFWIIGPIVLNFSYDSIWKDKTEIFWNVKQCKNRIVIRKSNHLEVHPYTETSFPHAKSTTIFSNSFTKV